MGKHFYFKQFSLALVDSSFWSMERTLSSVSTLGKSEPWSDGNKRALRIPQSSSIIEASPSDCLVSYLGHSFGESYPSAEMKSAYSVSQPTGPIYDCVCVCARARMCVCVCVCAFYLVWLCFKVYQPLWVI